ncbi:hypothetical protein Hypma_006156 [Hypsizygus marmoreus]|uniref:Uncharacterized protein n=1 Tax=Hypsizygus marmoreus TaxID=39966 RepID=A0A369JUQ4_HYPMA|nr:hypothetical protein Hypma_006156 [Hypsizygus marmoreus]
MPTATPTPRLPPGLQRVDTAANLKAIAALKLELNDKVPKDTGGNVTISIVPPTACLSSESEEPLKFDQGYLHTGGKYCLPSLLHRSYMLEEDEESDPQYVVLLPDDILDDARQKNHFFLPPEVFSEDRVEDEQLLKKLDEPQAPATSVNCTDYCLKRHAEETAHVMPQTSGRLYPASALYSPVYPKSSGVGIFTSRSSSSNSDSDINTFHTSDTSIDGVSRSSSPFSSVTTSDTSVDSFWYPLNDDIVEFRSSRNVGVLLTDIKMLKAGCLLDPNDEVLNSWGTLGWPAWIRVILNRPGYYKRSFFIPIKCHCSVITRAKLAWDIASVVELYVAAAPIDWGMKDETPRRRDISGLYLHTLIRDLREENIVWRLSVSESKASFVPTLKPGSF